MNDPYRLIKFSDDYGPGVSLSCTMKGGMILVAYEVIENEKKFIVKLKAPSIDPTTLAVYIIPNPFGNESVLINKLLSHNNNKTKYVAALFSIVREIPQRYDSKKYTITYEDQYIVISFPRIIDFK